MQRFWRLALRLAYLAFLAWLSVCAGVYFLQRQMLYLPQPRHVATPLLTLPTPAGDVLVAVREQVGPDALIYFGGNAEDVSLTLDELAQLFPGHALYLLHYRGFGGSAGEPAEAALVADALALFDTVRARHAKVALIGRSLGSGVAIQLAARRPIQRLVLVTPFDSVEQVAARVYPWLPVRWLLKDRFDSTAHAPGVKAPTLVLTAGRDQVVPGENSRRLIASFPSALVVHRAFPAADHDDVSSQPGYGEALKNFLLPAQGPSPKG